MLSEDPGNILPIFIALEIPNGKYLNLFTSQAKTR